MSLRYSFQIILFQRYDAIEALSGYNVRQTALGFAHIERLSNFSLFLLSPLFELQRGNCQSCDYSGWRFNSILLEYYLVKE